MATQSTQFEKAVSANPQRLRGGMTILGVGTVSANSPVTDTPTVQDWALRSRIFGSVVQQPLTDEQIAGLANNGPEPNAGRSHSPTYKPYSAGTFAYQSAGEYIIRSFSSKISGVDSSVVRIPGTLGRRYSILPNHRLRITHLHARTWTVNGLGLVRYTNDINTYSDMVHSISDGVFADSSDNAALPTRSVPGELVYVDANPNSPKQANYSAKTGA